MTVWQPMSTAPKNIWVDLWIRIEGSKTFRMANCKYAKGHIEYDVEPPQKFGPGWMVGKQYVNETYQDYPLWKNAEILGWLPIPQDVTDEKEAIGL